jgi:hypothetical protein
LIRLITAGTLMVLACGARSSDDISDFGTSGLIKMPNARMAPDSTLRATIAIDEVANLYNITFQALPKIQATFRYAIFNPNNVRGSRDGLRDRSYEVKAELFAGTDLLPQVAIGARDILGTGAWEGEYFVASKAWGDFDVTLGIGWGRLGSRSGFSNPLGRISSDFDNRPGSTGDTGSVGGELGGKSRGKSFFRGDAAVFGGLAHRFAKIPLTLIAEYESDQYDREVSLGTLDSPSAWNFGLAWEPWTGVSLRASWLRGDTLGLTLSSQATTNVRGVKKAVKRSVPDDLNESTGLPDGYNPNSWYDQMLFGAEQSGLLLKEGSLERGGRKVSMVIENRQYNLTADAVSQAALLGEYLMPQGVSSIDILLEEDGLNGPTINYTLQRKTPNVDSTYKPAAGDAVTILAPRELFEPTNTTDYGFPSLAFGLDLAAKVQLMDPDDPFRKQVYAKLSGRLQLSDHWNVWMRYEQNLYNDFSTARVSDSRLAKVRTDVNRYLVEGESGIEQLYIEYRKSLSPTVHSRFYTGLLELMYGGVGGELLYSPYKRRWALGVSMNAVKQRGFKRNFEFRDYETITAHVSAYYALPIYDIDMAVHVGRYLAEDRGYTFEARRTFDSGFSLGGFFTRTNVSAEDFGEGSFDKGLFFRIPFDGFLPGNTRASYSTILRPLERDGGRRLEGFSGSLWFARRAVRFDALDRNRDRILAR